jgi:hypothetical protein
VIKIESERDWRGGVAWNEGEASIYGRGRVRWLSMASRFAWRNLFYGLCQQDIADAAVGVEDVHFASGG